MSDLLPSDPKDVELESLIYRRIREMATDIHVLVKEGHVTLSGIADEYGTKKDIEVVVKEIGGVHGVTNNMLVAPTAD